jgi:type IV pilus assembly protein PilW
MKSTPQFRHQQISNLKKQSLGLSMVELMVGMTISLILLAGVLQIFYSSKKVYTLQDNLGTIQEGARYAVRVISKDLRRAGYWGGNADIDTIEFGTVQKVDVTTSNYKNCNGTWGLKIKQRIFGIDDEVGNYGCIPDSGDGKYDSAIKSDVLTVRYVDATQLSSADMTANSGKYYLRTSLFQGKLFFGADEGAASNNVNGIVVNNHELIARAYYVGDSGKTCQDKPIPSLFRVYLDNGLPKAQEVVRGVEDFQVQYGLDTTGDGFANQYLDAGGIGNNEVPWNSPQPGQTNVVVSVRFWILMRAECFEPGYTNEKTYAYADKADLQAYKPNDSYRRQLYSATVALRN